MASDTDRMARAGHYVMGLMSEAERERAERDIAFDPSFRDAVLSIAEKMRASDATSGGLTTIDEQWSAVSDRIAQLPQMRGIPTVRPHVTVPTIAGNVRAATGGVMTRAWLPVLVVMTLMAVFAAGYALGISASRAKAKPPVEVSGLSK